ncbi:MAG: hypothetical protein QMD22_11080, partial [archaeon]|nr:hypothetical protein [archaeon]
MMNKKILIIILVTGLILLSEFVLWSMEKEQKPTAVPQELKQEAQKRLSEVKIASLYENINDGVLIGRNINETISILK